MTTYLKIGVSMLKNALGAYLTDYSMIDDMGIDISNIVSCKLFDKKEVNNYSSSNLQVEKIKKHLRRMEKCQCIYRGYMTSNASIHLEFIDGTGKVICISSDGKYLGCSVPRSSFSYWYYLSNANIGNEITNEVDLEDNPFKYL